MLGPIEHNADQFESQC